MLWWFGWLSFDSSLHIGVFEFQTRNNFLSRRNRKKSFLKFWMRNGHWYESLIVTIFSVILSPNHLPFREKKICLFDNNLVIGIPVNGTTMQLNGNKNKRKVYAKKETSLHMFCEMEFEKWNNNGSHSVCSA